MLRQSLTNTRGALVQLVESFGRQTTLRGDVASNDLRRLLSQLGQDPALHSENVSGKLVLQWPGSPQNLSLDTLQGSLQA